MTRVALVTGAAGDAAVDAGAGTEGDAVAVASEAFALADGVRFLPTAAMIGLAAAAELVTGAAVGAG